MNSLRSLIAENIQTGHWDCDDSCVAREVNEDTINKIERVFEKQQDKIVRKIANHYGLPIKEVEMVVNQHIKVEV